MTSKKTKKAIRSCENCALRHGGCSYGTDGTRGEQCAEDATPGDEFPHWVKEIPVIKFLVITKVPKMPSDGNICDTFLARFKLKDCFSKKFESHPSLVLLQSGRAPKGSKDTIHIKAEVFAPGEILIVGAWGREYGYPQRKPSKWMVEYKEFDKVEDAIKCADRIRKKMWGF
jgi:hypothetical protein